MIQEELHDGELKTYLIEKYNGIIQEYGLNGISGMFSRQIVNSSATQSEKKFFKHLEWSQEIKTFAGAIVDEIDNTL